MNVPIITIGPDHVFRVGVDGDDLRIGDFVAYQGGNRPAIKCQPDDPRCVGRILRMNQQPGVCDVWLNRAFAAALHGFPPPVEADEPVVVDPHSTT